MSKSELYLASRSPRRRELLEQIGLRFSIVSADVDESVWHGETPEAYVLRLAKAKAQRGLELVGDGLVIAADTTVAIDNDILGKPEDQADAISIWTRLSGREHRVLTGVAVAKGPHVLAQVVTTKVQFREISLEEMQAYWNTGEPADKAGAYGIQGRAAIFVNYIAGSYSNVVGLPLTETAALLEQQGYSVW